MRGYEEIISLPHHVSERHARMSMLDRAAQFSPFAALTGYDAAIRETARLTDRRIELDESQREVLDKQLREAVERKLPVQITFFREDGRKSGGAYVTTAGEIRRIDAIRGLVLMQSGGQILIEDIFEITVQL